MNSKGALFLHLGLFLTLVVGSIVCSFVILFNPILINKSIFLVIAITAGVLFVLSNLFMGGCPFTILERKLSEKEQTGSSYNGSCIVHYVDVWFGLKLSQRASDIIPIFFFLLPIILILIK